MLYNINTYLYELSILICQLSNVIIAIKFIFHSFSWKNLRNLKQRADFSRISKKTEALKGVDIIKWQNQCVFNLPIGSFCSSILRFSEIRQSVFLRISFQRQIFLFENKNCHPIRWRDSISRPMAPVSPVAGGDDTTRPGSHGTLNISLKRDHWFVKHAFVTCAKLTTSACPKACSISNYIGVNAMITIFWRFWRLEKRILWVHKRLSFMQKKFICQYFAQNTYKITSSTR
jgi:hypothetical protein